MLQAGNGKKTTKKADANEPPKAKPQGTAKKRTPQSAFDPAVGKDVYQTTSVLTAGEGKLA